MTRCVVGLFFAAGVLGLSGCAGEDRTPNESPNPFPTMGGAVTEQQREAVADDVVTFDEYQAGFDALSACVTKAGYSLAEIELYNDTLITYSIPAVGLAAHDTCYAENFEHLDIRWQLAHPDQGPVADTIRSCLESHGVTPERGSSPDETVDMWYDQLAELGIEHAYSCVPES